MTDTIAVEQLRNIIEADVEGCQLELLNANLESVFLEELASKGGKILWQYQRYVLVTCSTTPYIWSQWSATKFQLKKVESINQAAKFLLSLNRKWCNYSFAWHRRQELISSALNSPSKIKRFDFLEKFPVAKVGFWTLIHPELLLYTTNTTSCLPFGVLEFNENKVDPPSRAYLKLWEVFNRLGSCPKKDDVVVDLGSSPGGWTWVLASLGAKVYSIDKAPLAESIASLKNVIYRQESAFQINPADWLHVNWIFCDVICYPEKILDLIKNWIKEGYQGNMVLTIKFQGETNFSLINELQKIPGSQLIHLYHNKHKLLLSYLLNSKRKSWRH